MNVRWLAACALCCAGCAAEAPSSPLFPANNCGEAEACWTGSQCFEQLGACGIAAPTTPYEMVLQVAPASTQGALVERLTFPSQLVTASRMGDVLTVPVAVSVSGLIADPLGDPIPADVAFRPIPEQPGYPVAALVATSVDVAPSDPPNNLTARLPPNTSFQVTIQPLGEASTALPPVTKNFESGSGATQRFDYTYPAPVALTRRLVDELTQEPQAQRRVRLKSSQTDSVISSTSSTDEQGMFTLYVMPASSDETNPPPENARSLEVSLARPDATTNPWNEVIVLSHERLDTEDVATPTVPQRVQLHGPVEVTALERAPLAELTFVSSFPIPMLIGDLNDRDWCRSHISSDSDPPFVCRVLTKTTTDENGQFRVSLVPGDYQVYIAAGAGSDDTQRVATKKVDISIETQLEDGGGGIQGPHLIPLEPATVLRGSVQSPRAEALPNVTVRTEALGLVGTLGEVAAYNRSATAVTDELGEFALAVDKGYYDFVVEPPESSGYPWRVSPNREYSPAGQVEIPLRGIVLESPVLIAGAVFGNDVPLAGARIDVFAIVNDLRGYARAVQIGRAVTDADGRYTLALPPAIVDESKNN